MEVELEMAAAGGAWRWTPAVRAILNGGWTGRDMGAVRAHVIREFWTDVADLAEYERVNIDRSKIRQTRILENQLD